MPDFATQEPCGCIHGVRDGTVAVQFCKLHKAAPDLLLALQNSLDALGFFEAAANAVDQPPSLAVGAISCDITVPIERLRNGAAAFKSARAAIARATG